MASGNVEAAYATLQRVATENGKTMPKGRLVEPVNHNVCFLNFYR